MAQEVVLKLRVDDAGLELLQKELKGTGIEIEEIEKKHEKSDKAIKSQGKSLAKNATVVRELDKLTGGWYGHIVDIVDGFKGVNTQLKLSRGLLISTGIGALVVALGVIVAYWDEIVEFMTKANERLAKQISLSQQTQDMLNTELDLLKLKEQILITEGKNTDAIIAQKKSLIRLLQVQNGEELLLLEKQKTRLEAQLKEVTLWETFVAAMKGGVSGIGGASLIVPDQSELDAIEAVTKSINDARKQALELELELAKIENPEASGGKRDREQKAEGTTGEEIEAQTAKEQALFESLFEIKEMNNQALLDQQGNFLSAELQAGIKSQVERTEKERAQAILRVKAAEEEKEAKAKIVKATISSLENLGDALTAAGEHSKELAIAGIIVSRVASIAQIITNLGVANLKSIALTPQTGGMPFVAFNVATAALSIGAGVAASAKAISELGGSGGGGGASANVGATSTPPAFNIVDSAPENQLNQSLFQRNNEPIEAYVVEGSITNAQELKRKKVAASSL